MSFIPESKIQILAVEQDGERSIGIMIDGKPCFLSELPMDFWSAETQGKFQNGVLQKCVTVENFSESE